MDGLRSFGTDELTLRAEEVDSLRTSIDTKHVELERWDAFCQTIYKGIEGGEWEELVLSFRSFRELSQAAGAKMSGESQKTKALWAMKAVRDRREEFYDPARRKDISSRTKTRLELWEEHLKDPMAALSKALECLENPYEGWHLVSPFVVASLCRRSGFQSRWRKDFFKRCGKGPFGKASGLFWTHGMLWVCAQRPASGTKRKYGPDGGRCFFLIKRESFALAKAVEFKPFCARGDAQGMYFGCSTPDGSRR